MTAQPSGNADAAVAALIRAANIELIPLRRAQEKLDAVPAGTKITITCSPKFGLERTLEYAELAVKAGHEVTVWNRTPGKLVEGAGVAPTPGAAAQGQQVTVQRVISPTVTDEDITLLRQDLRAMKMQVIGQNMSLSDTEAQKFWPIYNHYVKDLQEVNNQKYALLKQYAEMWATMTDQDALIYVRNWLEVDGQAQALRLKYVPVVSQVLPGKKAATFFQLDRRLNMIVDLQLFSQIPLAHVKE